MEDKIQIQFPFFSANRREFFEFMVKNMWQKQLIRQYNTSSGPNLTICYKKIQVFICFFYLRPQIRGYFPSLQTLQFRGLMDQRRVVYTLGTIESFQTNILMATKHKQPNLTNATQQINFQTASTVFGPQNSFLDQGQASRPLNMALYPKKIKMIKKPAKGKESTNVQQKKEKQTVLYKYFKRRIFQNSKNLWIFYLFLHITQKTLEIACDNYKNFDLLRIIDWQMEAAKNLHLSKDTFYTAVALSKSVYSKQRIQRFSFKMIEVQAASILSLAAKLQSNKINFPEAISTVCGFNKSDIIDGQIFIMKNISFKVPILHIQTQMIEICVNWHKYLMKSANLLKMDVGKLIFGECETNTNWKSIGKSNLIDYTNIFDMMILRLWNKTNFEDIQNIRSIMFQALFMLINYHNKQFFPLKPSQRTYTVLVFQNFVKEAYGYEADKFVQLMAQLIKNVQNLNLLEKVSKYFAQSQSFTYSSYKQDVQGLCNTQSSTYDMEKEQIQFHKQRYISIIQK